jgi:DNA invertase Pin-like site-specific DNA recombinase
MTLSESTKGLKQYKLMQKENLALREAISRIEGRLTSLEALIPKQKIIVLREISKDEARKEIIALFSNGETLYYSDVAEKLRLDLQTVVEICSELQSEGEIEKVDYVL